MAGDSVEGIDQKLGGSIDLVDQSASWRLKLGQQGSQELFAAREFA